LPGLLLDTNAFLWLAIGSPRLSPRAIQVFEDPGSTVCVSVASLWELAIKVSLNKLELPQPLAAFVAEHVLGSQIEVSPILPAHVVVTGSLPLHHRDPFDRILVAQSLVESMPIVSADTALDAYGVVRIW
jgi:PIN domain nuclease of toxin-antitoxin system